jgi:SAM-dependent methyltransferase
MPTSRRSLIAQTSGGSRYSGIQMNCACGVHDEVERLILTHFDSTRDKAGCQVLDIAAGYGAMTKRLIDSGFSDVQAWDLNAEQMAVPGVPVTSVDLNSDFGAGCPESFDLVVAIEVLEHLENPRHFFRNLAMIMNDGAIAVVSTPNIESVVSRMDFLGHGGVRWFTPHDRVAWGHSTPVFSWQVEEASEAAGLTVLERGHNSARSLVTVEPGRKHTLKALIGLLMYPLMSGNKEGDINVWALARKS